MTLVLDEKVDGMPEGKITEVRDINGDGSPDAIISKGGTACHGMTAEGYSLVSKQADGAWKLISGATGIPFFLKVRWQGLARPADRRPKLLLSCASLDGQAHALNRHEYEGKRCNL